MEIATFIALALQATRALLSAGQSLNDSLRGLTVAFERIELRRIRERNCRILRILADLSEDFNARQPRPSMCVALDGGVELLADERSRALAYLKQRLGG